MLSHLNEMYKIDVYDSQDLYIAYQPISACYARNDEAMIHQLNSATPGKHQAKVSALANDKHQRRTPLLQCTQGLNNGGAGSGRYIGNTCNFTIMIAWCTSQGWGQCKPSHTGYASNGDTIPPEERHVLPGVDGGATSYVAACKYPDTPTIIGFKAGLPRGYCTSTN